MTKPFTGIDVSCQHCGKTFYVQPSRIGKVKYCSRTCLRKHQENNTQKQIEKVCVVCGKPFFVPKLREHNAKYCGHKCYGKSLTKKGTVTLHCKQCNKPFQTSPSAQKRGRKFCSIKCVHMSRIRQNTKYPLTTRDRIRRLGLLDNCHQCGYSKYPEILEIHHIDHNPANNDWSNLAVVCPNCHKEYHYGGARLTFIAVLETARARGLIDT